MTDSPSSEQLPAPQEQSLEDRQLEHNQRYTLALPKWDEATRAVEKDGDLEPDVRAFGDAERRMAMLESEGVLIEALKKLGEGSFSPLQVLDAYSQQKQLLKDAEAGIFPIDHVPPDQTLQE